MLRRQLTKKCRVPSHLLGTDADAPREFFCLEACEPDAVLARIGLLSFGIGVKPNWQIKGGKLLIGFNDRIAAFNLEDFAIGRESCLLSLFWEFVELGQGAHACGFVKLR